MIPDDKKCRELWDKYDVPDDKRKHLELVAEVAKLIASKSKRLNPESKINEELLYAAAMLHDLDKKVPKLPGEKHPDAVVRILEKEGMEEVAELVKSHPLHLILDPVTAPKSIEEKILFLSDKMVKYEVIGVDRRFELWNNEKLPPQAQQTLDKSFPLVKKLEKEITDDLYLAYPDFKEKLFSLKPEKYETGLHV